MQPQQHEIGIKNDEYEREQQHLEKQIKHMVILRKDHILMFFAVWKRTHIPELFQRNTYALPSFSHFSHFIAQAWPTIPKAHATPTNSNPHVLVQKSWRCMRGVHCKYIHLVLYGPRHERCSPGPLPRPSNPSAYSLNYTVDTRQCSHHKRKIKTFVICLTHANVWESMVKPCSCMQFI